MSLPRKSQSGASITAKFNAARKFNATEQKTDVHSTQQLRQTWLYLKKILLPNNGSAFNQIHIVYLLFIINIVKKIYWYFFQWSVRYERKFFYGTDFLSRVYQGTSYSPELWGYAHQNHGNFTEHFFQIELFILGSQIRTISTIIINVFMSWIFIICEIIDFVSWIAYI